MRRLSRSFIFFDIKRTSAEPAAVLKISTHNFPIISKTYQNRHLFYVLALSVSAKTDKHKFCFLDQIFKMQKIKMGNLSCNTVTQGIFHQNYFENIFLIVLKILLQVPIIPFYFYKRSGVVYQEKKHPG